MNSKNARNQMVKQVLTVVLVLVIPVMLLSCHVMQPYEISVVAPDSLYRDNPGQDTTTIATIPWKEVFTDPDLQTLIEEGINHNLDLQIAIARIDEAMASFKQSRMAFVPSATLIGSFPLAQRIPGGASPSVDEALASSSWELDFWGKLRNTKKANLMALKQSEAYRRAVQTQLVADIATQYYTLLAYDAQLKITQQTVEIRKEDVESMKLLKESNVVTGAAVVQSEANRYSAEVTIPALQKNIRETENSLSVLLGRVPGPIIRSDLDSQSIALDLKTGIPALLLANRPDVQEAEYQLRQDAALVHVAQAYFYPAVSLTAQAGLAGTNLNQIFNATTVFANVIGGLTEPLLNQGLNRQRLRVSKARARESLDAFKQTLLQAGAEVSNALYDYQNSLDKMKLRTQQIQYLQKSVEFTEELLKYTSATNYTDVLTSEQSLLSAQLSGIADKQQQLLALIELYRSLGGGVN
jgi:multidrug efflux system outer membrane protein